MPADSPIRVARKEADRDDPPRGRSAVVGLAAGRVDARFKIQRSPAYLHAVELSRLYATVRRPIVFVGPIGVGKSTLARFVHQLSGCSGRLVTVSAGEIPDSLAQSKLFGHMRGAFTGAADRQVGAIEAAANGTLLLDDIANLSKYVQCALLRVLEDRRFTPLGAVRDIPVTCRELYATTHVPGELAARDLVVPDFLSRLGEHVVQIPPLCQRPEDVSALAEHYVVRMADEIQCDPSRLTDEVRELLLAYDWPYNVRELKGVIERAVVHARYEGSTEIIPEHLPERFQLASPAGRNGVAPGLTAARVREALRRSGGNVSAAARQLGAHRNALYRYLPKRPRKQLSVDER